MATAYEECKDVLRKKPRTWLVTGVAGFIGGHLLETLLELNQKVVGLDNFATGFPKNLELIKSAVSVEQWQNFKFIEGDIRDREVCKKACQGIDIVSHQAAIGSVPRSIDDPITSHEANVDGFVNMLLAAKDAGVCRFVYASSSSVYGDESSLPKVEGAIGKPLSPYAATKRIDEVYADGFSAVYDIETVGLRYFNVFGARQDPHGAYAAVIPKWVQALMDGEECFLNGDGTTTRDFCYVANAVQANILAGTVDDKEAVNTSYNVAVGEQTTLLELYSIIADGLTKITGRDFPKEPTKQDFRKGDVPHSLADMSLAESKLGYNPEFQVKDGLSITVKWFANEK